MSTYYENNREECLQRSLNWYKRNRQERIQYMKEYNKLYYKNNRREFRTRQKFRYSTMKEMISHANKIKTKLNKIQYSAPIDIKNKSLTIDFN